MIIYFCDRNLKITGNASTVLDNGKKIVSDSTTEEIASGVNIFECKIACDDVNRLELEAAAQVGNLILKNGGRAFNNSENSYDSLYQIIETEYDTNDKTLALYCEDAGLELINKVAPGVTLTNKTLTQMLTYFIPNDWVINNINAPTGTKTYTWDGENTTTERINSVVELFDCEVYYSFEIERMDITKKVLNVIKKRGNQTAIEKLRLGRDIKAISSKSSIKELATALAVTGGTLESSDKPINLKNYTYNYTDSTTGDVYTVDKSTGQMRNTSAMKRWASKLDKDGLIVKSYSFDTTNKSILAGEARAELQKLSKPVIEYEVEFVNLPDSIQVGDRIYIIDELGELYLDVRLLSLTSSACTDTVNATIGDYVRKDSGVDAQLSALAKELAERARDGIHSTTISITSSGGNIFHGKEIATTLNATVFFGQKAITTQDELEKVFGEGARIAWRDDSGEIGEGFSIDTSTSKETYFIKARLEVEA